MIKNLLFDLGGVIMDIDKNRCISAFCKLGFENIADFLGDFSQKGAFAMLESGQITAAQFRDMVRENIDHEVPDSDIDNAFQAFLIGIPRHRLDALAQLRSKYGIYLLSNTNQIMWDGFIAQSFKAGGMCREDYFDGMVTSFRAKVMKPQPRIFDYCAKTLGIDPDSTLFLDDSQENCETARQCGFHAAHVPQGTEFTRILAQLPILQ